MLKYHFIKSGCSLGLCLIQSCLEIMQKWLTMWLLQETIPSTDENENAETEVLDPWIDIDMDFQTIEIVCYFLLKQPNSVKCLERFQFIFLKAVC